MLHVDVQPTAKIQTTNPQIREWHIKGSSNQIKLLGYNFCRTTLGSPVVLKHIIDHVFFLHCISTKCNRNITSIFLLTGEWYPSHVKLIADLGTEPRLFQIPAQGVNLKTSSWIHTNKTYIRFCVWLIVYKYHNCSETVTKRLISMNIFFYFLPY